MKTTAGLPTDLIERYLQEIGRNLSYRQRREVLSKLRSSLMDTLQAKFGADFSEEAAAQVIKEMGPPQKVAAAFDPEGQYLIGPALYPTFKLIVGIVLAAVLGGQLLALMIALGIGQKTVSIPGELAVIVNSLPAALGMVVIVFAVMQRYGVRPEVKEAAFDPRTLPALEGEEPVKRGEQIVSIVMGVIVLALLSQFALRGGFAASGLFENPVVEQYFFWIALSMVIGIVLDIWLLWKGRWQTATRIAKIGSEGFSLVMLFLLIQGHTAWLTGMGVGGLLDGLRQLPKFTENAEQVFGMAAFRMAFAVALIVTLADALVQLFRLVKGGLARNGARPLAVR